MCQREGVVDFAELLLRSYELLTQQRRAARALPAPLLAPARRRVPGHQRAAVQVAEAARRADSTAVFAVGDDDQSIYAFRGANVANMQHFERDFARPEQPVKLIKLEQNYRSHGHILDAANALIKHNQARLGKNLWTSEGKGEPVRAFAAPSRPRRGGVHRRRRQGPRRRRRRARRRSRVLYRSNAQSRVLEHALFNAGDAVSRLRRHALFRARRGQARARLPAPASPRPADDGAFLRVVNFPPRGIGARTLETLQDARAGDRHEPVAGRVQPARSPGKAGSSARRVRRD